MANIREVLTLEDRFSATFSRFLNLGEKAAGAANRARTASANYQSVLGSMDRRLITLNSQFAALTAEQNAMIDAGRRNTSEFAALDARMEKLGGTIRTLQSQYDLVEKEADQAAAATRRFESASTRADTAAGGLGRGLRSLVGAYAGIQGLRQVLSLSDTLTATRARLDMMNDGLQTTEELQNMIWQSAMRSRGAYADMAGFVAKLGTLAGDAFESNRELVAFAEQINKQMILSGTTATEARAAMLQITQGLSSGRLQGDELRAILEQTPMVAQTIARYMGVSTGEMRELASQGLVTAQVVKNAMLSAAEETDARFAQMPMTWEQLFTTAQNVAIKALEPMFDFISSIPQFIMDNYPIVISVMIGLAAVVALVAAKALIMAGAFALANLPLILLAAAVSAFIYGMMQAGTTATEVFTVIGEGFGILYAFVGNIIVQLYNTWASFAEFFANVFDNPVRAIANLFFDLIDTILGLLQTAAGAIDAVFGSNLAGSVQGWRDGLSRWVDNHVGKNKIQIERMESISYQDAMARFGQYGKELAGYLADFSAGQFATSGFEDSDWASQVDNIAGSVGNIEKAVALSEEDLKSLVDAAERRYVNNVTLTPVINVSGQNTGRTAADRQSLAEAIKVILLEQAAAGSARSTARPAMG